MEEIDEEEVERLSQVSTYWKNLVREKLKLSEDKYLQPDEKERTFNFVRELDIKPRRFFFFWLLNPMPPFPLPVYKKYLFGKRSSLKVISPEYICSVKDEYLVKYGVKRLLFFLNLEDKPYWNERNLNNLREHGDLVILLRNLFTSSSQT